MLILKILAAWLLLDLTLALLVARAYVKSLAAVDPRE